MSDGEKFHGVIHRLEMYVDRRLLAGIVAQTIGVTMMSEVGRTNIIILF